MSISCEYLIYTQSQSHTHRTSCGSRSWYEGDPQRVTEQNCKSILWLKHTRGGRTVKQRVQMLDGIWFGCWMCTLQVWAHVFWCQSLFPSLRGCNFPSLLPSGEQMVSIATGWMVFFVWVLMDIFLGVMFVWEWEIHHHPIHHISLFMWVLSLGRILT